MPMTHTIEDGLVVVRVSGKLSNEDHRACFDGIVTDPDFISGTAILLFDTGGLYAPSSEEAQALVALVSDYQNNPKKQMVPFAVGES